MNEASDVFESKETTEQDHKLYGALDRLNNLIEAVADLLSKRVANEDRDRDESEQVNELFAAMAKAQGKFENAIKDSQNPHFRSNYADLASIWDACRQPLSENGLSVIQRVRSSPDGLTLETRLCHSSGQWMRDCSWWPIAQRTPQAIGSAITYARRYTIAPLLGIAPEDDDGNAASMPGRIPPTTPPKVKPKSEIKSMTGVNGEVVAINGAKVNGEPSADEIELASLREHLQAAESKADVDALGARISKASAWLKDQIRPEFTARKKELS